MPDLKRSIPHLSIDTHLDDATQGWQMSGQEGHTGGQVAGHSNEPQSQPATANRKSQNQDQQPNRYEGTERRPRNDRRPARRETEFGQNYERRKREPREYIDGRRPDNRRNEYFEQEREPSRSRPRFDEYNDRGNWNRPLYEDEVPRRQVPRYRDSVRTDSGYYDDKYGDPSYHLDDSDYHRPLSFNRQGGARPLYRARSLPQNDFLSHEADFYPLRNDHLGSAPVQRPYSNLGDYGYEQGINSYFGMDSKRDR